MTILPQATPSSTPVSQRLIEDGYVTCSYLVARTFGINTSILLEYLVGWGAAREDQWCYRTAAQIEAETILTPDEQRTARTKLKALGILTEALHRAKKGDAAGSPVVHYHVDWSRALQLMNETPRRPNPIGRKDDSHSRKIPNPPQENPETTLVNNKSHTKESVRNDVPQRVKTVPKTDELFDQFWAAYPKGRSSKQTTLAVWKTLTDEQRYLAVEAIPKFKRGHDWKAGYHKAAERYLKSGQYEDPPPPERSEGDPPSYTLEEEKEYQRLHPYFLPKDRDLPRG